MKIESEPCGPNVGQRRLRGHELPPLSRRRIPGSGAGRRPGGRSSRARSAAGRAPTRPARSSSRRRAPPARCTFSSHRRSLAVGSASASSSAACFCANVLHVAKPVVDQAELRARERRAHAAAAVVAAHDHVLHPQHVDGVLQHRQAVEVRVHHHVRDVAVHEQLSRRQSTISFAGTRLSEQPIHR